MYKLHHTPSDRHPEQDREGVGEEEVGHSDPPSSTKLLKYDSEFFTIFFSAFALPLVALTIFHHAVSELKRFDREFQFLAVRQNLFSWLGFVNFNPAFHQSNLLLSLSHASMPAQAAL